MANSTFLTLQTSLMDIDCIFDNYDSYVRDVLDELYPLIKDISEKYITYQSDVFGKTDVHIYFNTLNYDGGLDIKIDVEYENTDKEMNFLEDIVLEQRVIEALSELIDQIAKEAVKVKVLSCDSDAEIIFERKLYLAIDKNYPNKTNCEFIPLEIRKPTAEVISTELADHWG